MPIGDAPSLPKGWEVKKLGDVITLEYGKPLDKYKRIDKGQYPVYGANGIKAKTDEYYYDKKTIIVGRKGSAGEINLTEEKFWPLDVTYFVKFEKKQIDLYFLYFWLSKLNLPKLAKGVKPGINRNDVYDLMICIPLLPEQKRIVAILDQAFTAINKAKANTEQNLKNAREVFQSALQTEFENGKLKIKNGEWKEKTLGEVCEIKPPKKLAKDKLLESELVTFFPMAHLKVFNHYIKPYQTKQLKDVYQGYVYFENGDVLLAKITPCFENGKLGIASGLQNGIGFGSSEYMVFRPDINTLPEYIYYFLSLDSIRKNGKGRMTGAVGHKRIPVDYILNQKLIISPLPEQKRITKKLDAISTETKKLETFYQQKINDLAELKKSILQKAFGGEL